MSMVNVVIAAVIALPLCDAACAADKSPVKIGVVLSLSGPAAVFGVPERDAITAVTNELNEKASVGRKIELVIADDKTNPTEAVRAVTQLTSNEHVVAIIGPGTGSNILAAGPVAQAAGVPLLAPAGTLAVTDPSNSFFPWVFRILPSDRVAVKVMMEGIAKSGAKKIGVFFQEDAYGKTGVDLARQLAGPMGLEVAETVSAPYTATDLTAQAIRLRNASVDSVILQTFAPGLGSTFMKAAREVGLKAPIYANAGLAQRSFVESAGSDSSGLRVLSIGNLPYAPSSEEAELADLLKHNDKTPQGWGELAGANAIMSVAAVLKAIGDGEITGQSMKEGLESACGFRTYSRGKPCFSRTNHDGWSEDALVITELRDKQLKPVE